MVNAKSILEKIKESVEINEGGVDLSKPWAVILWGKWQEHPNDITISKDGRVGLIRDTFDTEGKAKKRAKACNAVYTKGQKVVYDVKNQVVDLRTIPKADIHSPE